MSDLRNQIRDYFEVIAPVIDIDEVHAHPLLKIQPTGPEDRRASPRRLVPALVSVLVLIVAAGIFSTVPVGGSGVRVFVQLDACEVLSEAFPGRATMTSPHRPTSWGADVCLRDNYDSGWNFRHLLLRQSSTSREEARELIEREELLLDAVSLTWTTAGPGRWITEDSGTPPGFAAVAVSDPPFFYIVTEEDSEEARQLADAVADTLAQLASQR